MERGGQRLPCRFKGGRKRFQEGSGGDRKTANGRRRPADFTAGDGAAQRDPQRQWQGQLESIELEIRELVNRLDEGRDDGGFSDALVADQRDPDIARSHSAFTLFSQLASVRSGSVWSRERGRQSESSSWSSECRTLAARRTPYTPPYALYSHAAGRQAEGAGREPAQGQVEHPEEAAAAKERP